MIGALDVDCPHSLIATGMRVLENNALESNRQNRRFSLAMPNLIDMGFRISKFSIKASVV